MTSRHAAVDIPALLSNRTERCPVKIPKLLAKKHRGFCDYQLNQSANVLVVGWNDNRPVYLASNIHGVSPVGVCTRWSSSEKKKVTVQLPDLVGKYNKYMGGVDRMDQNTANYRVGVRSKKWWWPVFVFCVETGIHNAWQIYRKTEQGREDPRDLLEFRRRIVKTYLVKYADKPKNAGRPKNRKPIDKRVPDAVRYDGLHHWCIPAPKQNRCTCCHKNTTKMCEKCSNVNLHDGLCFKEYTLSETHMKTQYTNCEVPES